MDMRGFWLGLLIALTPMTQFFTAALWGAISDSKECKRVIQFTLCITIVELPPCLLLKRALHAEVVTRQ